MSKTKRIAQVQKAINEARKAGFDYSDKKLVDLMAEMDKLTVDPMTMKWD